jgi:small subunit ribosomal protein S9
MAQKSEPKSVNASGKRKTAIARATVRKGAGRVRINSVPLELYEPEIARMKISEPLVLADVKCAGFDIDVEVHGGGQMGQAAAVRTAIAKGLVEALGDEALEALYRQYDRGLLVSDPRRKLPKKPCGKGARRKRQKSYR